MEGLSFRAPVVRRPPPSRAPLLLLLLFIAVTGLEINRSSNVDGGTPTSHRSSNRAPHAIAIPGMPGRQAVGIPHETIEHDVGDESRHASVNRDRTAVRAEYDT